MLRHVHVYVEKTEEEAEETEEEEKKEEEEKEEEEEEERRWWWGGNYDGFITHHIKCVTWLICMCDMAYLYVWHDSCVFVTWLITSYVWHDSFVRLACLIHMCDMA